jgi:hypothetical protein
VALDRALAIVPDNVEMRTFRPKVELFWKADTRPLHQAIDEILAQGPSAIVSAGRLILLRCGRTRSGCGRTSTRRAGDNPCWDENVITLSRSFGEGLLARMTKDEARARTAFETARAQQENMVEA